MSRNFLALSSLLLCCAQPLIQPQAEESTGQKCCFPQSDGSSLWKFPDFPVCYCKGNTDCSSCSCGQCHFNDKKGEECGYPCEEGTRTLPVDVNGFTGAKLISLPETLPRDTNEIPEQKCCFPKSDGNSYWKFADLPVCFCKGNSDCSSCSCGQCHFNDQKGEECGYSCANGEEGEHALPVENHVAKANLISRPEIMPKETDESPMQKCCFSQSDGNSYWKFPDFPVCFCKGNTDCSSCSCGQCHFSNQKGEECGYPCETSMVVV